MAWRTNSLSNGFWSTLKPTYMMFRPGRSTRARLASFFTVSKSSVPTLSMPSAAPDCSCTSRCAASLFHWKTSVLASALVPQ